jgi:hypothetical protein
MKKRKITATILATIVGVTTLGVAAFGVDDSKEVRQADLLLTLGAGSQGEADVRTKGSYEFLEEGLHITTNDHTAAAADSNNKVAEYWAPRGGSTEVPTTYTQDWFGDGPVQNSPTHPVEPGKQIVFDLDTNRTNANSFNVLVGEPIYGDDWWMPGGTTRATERGITCPQTGGGNGSDCFGTLAEWKSQLTTDNMPVYAYGFSLGSGVKGEGVLRSQTVNGVDYIFTDETNVAPGTPEAHTQSAPVVANLTWANVNKKTDITFTSNNPAANDTLRGTKVVWRITVDGVGKFSSTMGWGENEHYVDAYPKSDPNHVVRVYKNGALFSTKTVTTN